MVRSPLVRIALGFLVILLMGYALTERLRAAEPEAAAPKVVLSQSGLNYPALVTQQKPLSVSFVLLGDTGSGFPEQKQVTDQLMAWRQTHPYKFMMILGDIIYVEKGATFKTYLQHCAKDFDQAYAALRKAGVKVFTVLGNHDLLWGYSPELLSALGMPATYYDYTVGPVQVFALNTSRFDAAQQTWLESRLDESKAPWKLVVGHYPVLTSGQHQGDKDHQAMMTTLKPILEAHQVPLYIAGHDHDYERFKPVGGVQYVVTGGGGAGIRGFKKTIDPNSVQRASVHHFLYIQATASQFTIQAIDTQGTVIDSLTLTKPKTTQPLPQKPKPLKPAA